MNGKLYVVATPIGNLEDISLRAIRILGEADLIAAEDTRVSGRLLKALEIKKPLISYFEHNKSSRSNQLLKALQDGKNIALISDAGLPGICDPGADLIKQALALQIEVTVIPGANAALTGLILSGLDSSRFSFEGFVERKKSSRQAQLQALSKQDKTMIFYESPHRLRATLNDMAEIFGQDRPAALARELTKLYEETKRGSLSELRAAFESQEPRGEFVIIIAAAEKTKSEAPAQEQISAELELLMAEGNSRKEAARILAKKYDLAVKIIYDASLTKDLAATEP